MTNKITKKKYKTLLTTIEMLKKQNNLLRIKQNNFYSNMYNMFTLHRTNSQKYKNLIHTLSDENKILKHERNVFYQLLLDQ